MKVLINDDGFITSFAIVGDIKNSIELPDPEDVTHFFNHFSAYKVDNGMAIFDDKQNEILQQKASIDAYRVRRSNECFTIINRGQLWYNTLTDEQKNELDIWYHNWLDGTPTQTVPEKPEWIRYDI